MEKKNPAMEIKSDTQVAVIEEKTNSLMGRISDVKIFNQKSYDYANDILKDVLLQKKQVDIILGPRRDLTYKAYKSILDLIKETMDPLITLEKKLKSKIGNYLTEQRLIKEKADEEAREKEKGERNDHVDVLKKHGMDEEADKILSRPMGDVKSEVKEVSKGGSFTVTTWSAKIVSMKELIDAVSTGETDIQYLMPNYQLLNEMARQKGDLLDIPGVKATKNISVRTRT